MNEPTLGWKPMPEKFCKYCNEKLVGGRKDRVFCDKDCAALYQKQAWHRMNPKTAAAQLANNTVAEMNEMRVTLDLLSRGYEVYRAAVAGMQCDLYVLHGQHDVGKRVEVTSGNLTPSGTLQHPHRDEAKFDVLAVVVGDTIHYKPELT